MNERIEVPCKEWRMLRRIGWLTRVYVETITILLAMEWLQPKGLLQSATLIILFFAGLQKITGWVAKKISSHYSITV